MKIDIVIQCHRKEGLLNMQFLVLVKNEAELGPYFNDMATSFSSCPCCSAFTHSAHSSVKHGPQGRKCALFCHIGLSIFLQVQRAGVKTQKDNVLCILVKCPAPMQQTSQNLIKGWIPQTPTLKMNTAVASQQRKKKSLTWFTFLRPLRLQLPAFF